MTDTASGPVEAPTVEATPGAAASPEDQRFLAALRGGDEAAFAELVDRHGGSMLRGSRISVP